MKMSPLCSKGEKSVNNSEKSLLRVRYAKQRGEEEAFKRIMSRRMSR